MRVHLAFAQSSIPTSRALKYDIQHTTSIKCTPIFLLICNMDQNRTCAAWFPVFCTKPLPLLDQAISTSRTYNGYINLSLQDTNTPPTGPLYSPAGIEPAHSILGFWG